MNDKKNLTKDELANYLKNLKDKAPPKPSSLITPPKSPIASTAPSNNNRKRGGLYGPRVYPSPKKITSILGQKIGESIKTPSSPPESVSSSTAYSSSSSTRLNTTDTVSSGLNFNEADANKIDGNNDINGLINDLTYPMETKLSFKLNNNQSTDINSGYNNNNNIDERTISANASTTKIDNNTKDGYVLSAAFKSYSASSRPASRTPSLIKQTTKQIQSEVNKNKKIYNSTVNMLQKQHQFNKQLNNELENNDNNSQWNPRYDETQKKFPHSEKLEYNHNSIPTSPTSPKIYTSNNQPFNGSSRPSSSMYNVASIECAACNKSITGKVLSAMGKKWHPDHFTCTTCNTSLEHIAFFEQDGLPYCHLDFHELFSPRCGYCNTPIEGQCITALGKSWHVGHFFCRECGGPFESGGFMVHDGYPYCEKDWMKKFAPKCKGCQNPIKEEFTSALDGKWHRDCFGCKTCNQPFHSSYYVHQGQPYCDVHYREIREF
ncbi:176_t:CDS:2 [Entrophospora sp. SA101]|nr:176_t:CDS:2 [Entrophospora sp. SA101]CAJ0926953.1 13204_t:CDS:2 [Entrophospora sp. SA101]